MRRRHDDVSVFARSGRTDSGLHDPFSTSSNAVIPFRQSDLEGRWPETRLRSRMGLEDARGREQCSQVIDAEGAVSIGACVPSLALMDGDCL